MYEKTFGKRLLLKSDILKLRHEIITKERMSGTYLNITVGGDHKSTGSGWEKEIEQRGHVYMYIC